MRRDFIIVNDFYEDPDRIVAMAKSMDYYLPYNRGQDPNSPGIKWRSTRWKPASDCPFKSSRKLIYALEEITGEKINMDYWNRDFAVDSDGHPSGNQTHSLDPERACLWNCTFHAKHLPSNDGEWVHNHTNDAWHSVTDDGWAGVVYLTRKSDFSNGLLTWQNVDPSRNRDIFTPPENWKKVDQFGFVYNRLILHRGGIPHSGGHGWGNNLENGRFFQTFFFRTLGVKWIEKV